jgi:hypothetical protein
MVVVWVIFLKKLDLKNIIAPIYLQTIHGLGGDEK